MFLELQIKFYSLEIADPVTFDDVINLDFNWIKIRISYTFLISMCHIENY